MRQILLLLMLPCTLFAQIFKGESVEYDSIGHRFLTSDDGTSIVQRADDGTVSYFGTGTKAKYGMEIMQNKLFTISGSNVFVYDLPTAAQLAVIPISGAGFLNGMASDGINRIWLSDFSTGRIIQIEVSDLSQPIVSTTVSTIGGTPNGLVHEAAKNRLVVATWGANAKIKAIDLATNAVSTLATTSLTNIDGIDMDVSGNFYLAAWSPDRILRYNNDFSQSSTVAVASLNNPADICYSLANDTLAIPNTGGSNILFVGFQPASAVQNLDNEVFEFKISPNPVQPESAIIFKSPQAASSDLRIFDALGKLVFTENEVPVFAGENRISLPDFSQNSGIYYCYFTFGGYVFLEKVVK